MDSKVRAAVFCLCAVPPAPLLAQCGPESILTEAFGTACRISLWDPWLTFDYYAPDCRLSVSVLSDTPMPLPLPVYDRVCTFLVVGVRRAEWQLPCCNLCTFAIEPLTIQANASCSGSFVWTVPANARGATFLLQGAVYYRIRCPLPPPTCPGGPFNLPAFNVTRGYSLTFR
jgi:hypothetical protein